MLTEIGLFAGIGGFQLGFQQAGIETVALVEIDTAAQSVLRRRFPGVPILPDVQNAGAHNLPSADILSFGFPCQDLSVAGKRSGLAGVRSGLFYEATRIADELRPMFLVWENVPGLLSSNSGRDFAAVLMELERIGYSGCWTTLDAQFFGVAQRRQRIFGVFARRDIGAAVCAEILSLTARLPWNTAAGRKARAGVASAVTRSSGYHGRSSPRGDGSDNLITLPLLEIGKRTNGDGYRDGDGIGSEGDPMYTLQAGAQHGVMVASTLNSGGNSGGFRTEPGEHLVAVRDIAPALTQNYGKQVDSSDTNLGPNVVLSVALRGREGGGTAELAGEQATALRSSQGGGDKPHALGAFGVRRLTPLECERLQGFPDGWTEGQSDSTRYRQLGNAVAVPCARWIGRQIVRHL